MTEHHIGVDIIEIDRIEKAIARWGERFLKRVYTDAELMLFRNHTPSLAARFAGKEAVMKALSPRTPLGWKEIEILSGLNGKPVVLLDGEAQSVAESLCIDSLEISLSHSKEHAIAFVIGTVREQ